MVRQTSELPAQRRCEVLLLDTNGYTAGLDTKIPVGRIVCDSTFDPYSLHGVNGEDHHLSGFDPGGPGVRHVKVLEVKEPAILAGDEQHGPSGGAVDLALHVPF